MKKRLLLVFFLLSILFTVGCDDEEEIVETDVPVSDDGIVQLSCVSFAYGDIISCDSSSSFPITDSPMEVDIGDVPKGEIISVSVWISNGTTSTWNGSFHINWENNPSVCDSEFGYNANSYGDLEVQSGEDKQVIGSGTGCAGFWNVGAGAKEVTIYETDGTTVFHKLIGRFNLID